MRIEAHEAGQVAYESDYAYCRESIANFLIYSTRSWTDCEGLVDNQCLEAARFWASTDGVTAREALVAALDICVAGFCGTGQGELREQRVLGQVLARPTAAPTAGQSPSWWLRGHATGVALRRHDAVERLVACQEAAFDPRYLAHGDPNFEVVRAIQGWARGAPNWADHLRRAEMKFDPTTYGTPGLVRLERATILLFEMALTGDQAAFTKALHDAVKLHKAYWSVGANRTSPDGLLNLRLVGYATLGIQRGLALEVESDYIPAWLVLGAEPPARKTPIPKNPPKAPSKKRAR